MGDVYLVAHPSETLNIQIIVLWAFKKSSISFGSKPVSLRMEGQNKKMFQKKIKDYSRINVDTALMRNTEWHGIGVDTSERKSIGWPFHEVNWMSDWPYQFTMAPNLLTASIYSTKVNGRSWSQNKGYGQSSQHPASTEEVRSSAETTTSRNWHVLKSSAQRTCKLNSNDSLFESPITKQCLCSFTDI